MAENKTESGEAKAGKKAGLCQEKQKPGRKPDCVRKRKCQAENKTESGKAVPERGLLGRLLERKKKEEKGDRAI